MHQATYAVVPPKAEEYVLAVDSTRLSSSSRGEWIAHRYRVPPDFVKLYAAVEVALGTVVAATTSDRSGDAGRLPEAVRQVASRFDESIVTMLVDGEYDMREYFDCLASKGI